MASRKQKHTRESLGIPKNAKVITRGQKRKPTIQTPDISEERWKEIFGTTKCTPGSWTYDENGKSRKTDTKHDIGIGVLDDRGIAGVWDVGAGRVFNSRAERAKWMKEKNVECVG